MLLGAKARPATAPLTRAALEGRIPRRRATITPHMPSLAPPSARTHEGTHLDRHRRSDGAPPIAAGRAQAGKAAAWCCPSSSSSASTLGLKGTGAMRKGQLIDAIQQGAGADKGPPKGTAARTAQRAAPTSRPGDERAQPGARPGAPGGSGRPPRGAAGALADPRGSGDPPIAAGAARGRPRHGQTRTEPAENAARPARAATLRTASVTATAPRDGRQNDRRERRQRGQATRGNQQNRASGEDQPPGQHGRPTADRRRSRYNRDQQDRGLGRRGRQPPRRRRRRSRDRRTAQPRRRQAVASATRSSRWSPRTTCWCRWPASSTCWTTTRSSGPAATCPARTTCTSRCRWSSGTGCARATRSPGAVRQPREGERKEKFNPLVRLDTVNGVDPEQAKHRPEFNKLTPLYPQERLRLETEPPAAHHPGHRPGRPDRQGPARA